MHQANRDAQMNVSCSLPSWDVRCDGEYRPKRLWHAGWVFQELGLGRGGVKERGDAFQCWSRRLFWKLAFLWLLCSECKRRYVWENTQAFLESLLVPDCHQGGFLQSGAGTGSPRQARVFLLCLQPHPVCIQLKFVEFIEEESDKVYRRLRDFTKSHSQEGTDI